MTTEEETVKESGLSETAGIERMYQIYEKLNSAESKVDLEGEYREFMDAAHRSAKEKRLASQFITRFIEYFPNTYEDAVNTMLGLCEEEDAVIRKQVLKDLISVCKKVKLFQTCIPKIADAFCQLMYTADTAESQTIESSFVSFFNADARGTLAGIFAQIRDGEDIVREAAMKILVTRVKDLSPELATLSFQRCLYGEIQLSIKLLTDDEFKTLLDLLQNHKLLRQVGGEQELALLLYDRIDLDAMFKAEEPSAIETLFGVTDRALVLYKSNVLPNPLVQYYFTKILPVFAQFPGDEKRSAVQLNTLKRLCELLLHVTNIEQDDAKTCVDSALKLTFELLPDADSTLDLNFSLIECSLFFLYRVGSFVPSYLQSTEKFDELCARLRSLHRTATSYKETLRQAFKSHEAKPMDLTDMETKKKVIALKVLKNLNTFTRALLEDEIKYGQKIQLSWKPLTQPQPLFKRSSFQAPSGGFHGRPGKDRELQRYQPPGGKYSRGGGFGQGGSYGRGGGGGGGRGGFGRGRGNQNRGNNRRF